MSSDDLRRFQRHRETMDLMTYQDAAESFAQRGIHYPASVLIKVREVLAQGTAAALMEEATRRAGL